jgi:CRISPR-associated protein Cmr4
MSFLVLYAETAIHVGIGQVMGPIDLPVQRERHTGLPIIYGHGLKGSLRALAELDADDRKVHETEKDRAAARKKVNEVFGPPAESDLVQGTLVVGEALPLAIPLRAAGGLVFVWATCPLLLERFERRTGQTAAIPTVSPGQVVWAGNTGLVIEDLAFTRVDGQRPPDLSGWLPPAMPRVRVGETPDAVRDAVAARTVVLNDGDFVHLVRHALPVVARVKLTAGKTTGAWKKDPLDDKETPEQGHLWAQEMVPADSIFYAPVGDVERPGSAGAVAYLKGLLGRRSVVQIGGDETVGFGWCWVGLHDGPPTAGGGGRSS